jgi:hypothetical protein
MLVKSTNTRGSFLNSKAGFAGFRIFRGSPGGVPSYDYGWIKLHWSDALISNKYPAILSVLGWAYNTTPNQPIHVPGVPEPSTGSLMLLAAGAAGVRAWRKHRKASN